MFIDRSPQGDNPTVNMNAFGKNFRITVFGESHGPAIGVVLDGVPAGMPLSTYSQH